MRMLDVAKKIQRETKSGTLDTLQPWVIAGIIEIFLKEVRETLQKGETVSIRGFGKMSFYYNRTGKRPSFDFKTGTVRTVGCKPKIKFDALFDFDKDLLEKGDISDKAV